MNLDVQQRLIKRLRTFPGNYECHITVEAEVHQIDGFRKLCAELDSKALVIVLDNGLHPRQPMLAKILKGSPEEVVWAIVQIVQKLSQLFRVIRVKIETELSCPSVPNSKVEAQGLSKDCYFEFHIRLRLQKDEIVDELRNEVKSYEGHLSNNALSENGRYQQRFITQRFKNIGKEEAEQGLEELLSFLKQKKLCVDKVIREFNIFDSNADLDSGWGNE